MVTPWHPCTPMSSRSAFRPKSDFHGTASRLLKLLVPSFPPRHTFHIEKIGWIKPWPERRQPTPGLLQGTCFPRSPGGPVFFRKITRMRTSSAWASGIPPNPCPAPLLMPWRNQPGEWQRKTDTPGMATRRELPDSAGPSRNPIVHGTSRSTPTTSL